ncbi:glycoside hydrolase family 2 [Pedobacter sp. Leaf194]|uniref:glycoside hydrolase family 2 n=1 Tax=Pedobacter sp. Leaf194 TaxID=1736297 RepID=UPI0007029751|nr:glycoside hydrolase family 2 [Pedobacter sp. Leaf194]KQS36781.1 hypothetical protein ASG14_07015 [Pedobacter sp. Leaf194]
MRLIYPILFFLTIFYVGSAEAQSNKQPRKQFSINDNWKFKKGGHEFVQTAGFNPGNWARIDLPHTWNASDPFTDEATYYRGISWYRKELQLNQPDKFRRTFIFFEGSNQVTDVWINNNFVGRHKGGYTAFNFDITPFIKTDGSKNVLAIQVNNATDFTIPPLSVGYAMYGGIYRDCWIIETNEVHFSFADHGSTGVYINTPKVSKENATINLRTIIKNDSRVKKIIEIINEVYDAEGKLVLKKKNTQGIEKENSLEINMDLGGVKSPKLWSPDHPYLYKVVSKIVENGHVTDEINTPLGFRFFSFSTTNGFSLNGEKYQLKGTNRHQDLKGKGSALTNEDHYRDMKIIKGMGCNFLRLAHYPQDPEVLRLADVLGLLIWEEIPVVNNISTQSEFTTNSQNMAREMIRQHYNHPSIILWGSMNEVLLWSPGNERISTQNDTAYLAKVRIFQKTMDSTVRAEDSSRYSTMAMHMSEDYEKYHMAGIPQVAGWNIYNGWYSGKFEEFGTLLDEKHKKHPNEVIFISEYGAESDNQLNGETVQRLDFSGAYQRLYHEAYLEQINQRPYLAGTAIWNEFDFSQPNVGGSISHLNHKGMVTWDRKKKDVYYLYKANWNPEPMVYIATRDWLKRAGKKNKTSTIDIYSNLENVNLSLNGEKINLSQASAVKKYTCRIQLKAGENTLRATGKKNGLTYADEIKLYYQLTDVPLNTALFKSLAINVGSTTQYLDDSDNIWVEDQAYVKGSYGFISGEKAMMSIKSLITHTDDTPLFYSYLNGLKAYRIDVAPGRYEVELCFAEPDKIDKGERIFDVSINDEQVERKLDLTSEHGFAVAFKRKYIIDTNSGINITFSPVKGKTILNGLKINRL